MAIRPIKPSAPRPIAPPKPRPPPPRQEGFSPLSTFKGAAKAAVNLGGAAAGATEAVNHALDTVMNVVRGTSNTLRGAAETWSQRFNTTLNGVRGLLDGAAATAANVTGALLSDPGAAALKPIDRAAMSPIDKAIVNAAGFDKMVPGQKTTVTVTASAELAAVLGVNVGAKVILTVERSAEDPNKFKFTLGGEGELSGKLTGDTAGASANAGLGATGSAAIELTVDLSKPGAATELAAFAAHAGLLAGLAALPGVGAAAAAVLTGIEALPGVRLPGEPVDYLRTHLSAVEVGVGGKLTATLGAVLGPSVAATLENYLKGGGRVEFNPDGTLTLRARVTAGGGAAVKGGVGVPGVELKVETELAGAKAEVTFERSMVVNPGPPPRVQSEVYSASFKVEGAVLGQGGSATVKVSIDQLPPDLQTRVLGMLARGDTQGAAQLVSEAVNSGRVSASLDLTASSKLGVDAKAHLEEVGTGGGVGVGASVKTEVPVGSVDVEVTATGVKLKVAAFGFPAGTELTWDQLRELAARAASAVVQ